MTEHVTSLAEKHHVRVIWLPSKDWRAAEAVPGIVRIPRITKPSDYLFGLHELGHCLAPDAVARWTEPSPYDRILCEGAAWAWASAAAKPSLLRHMRAKDWNRVAYAYRTYLDPRNWSWSSQEPPSRSVRHSGQSALRPT